MTNHPLTDEKVNELIAPELMEDWIPIEEAMRLAADWQLEEVVAHILAAEWFGDPDRRISELRKAMRPTTQEDS